MQGENLPNTSPVRRRAGTGRADPGEEYMYKHLDEDHADFIEACQTGCYLVQSLRSAIEDRKKSIDFLKILKKGDERSYDKSIKAQIGGRSAVFLGSILGIAGFVSAFFILGVGIVLVVGGAVLGAAGAVTVAGSQVGYLAVSHSTLKNARIAFENDRKRAASLGTLGQKFNQHLESLAEKHGMTSEKILQQLKHNWKFGFVIGKNVGLCIGKGTEAVIDTTKALSWIVKNSGVHVGTHLTITGLRSVSGVIRVGAVALDVIFVPVELAMIVNSACDVHKYKTTGESNSKAAKEIDILIQILQSNLEQMEACLKELLTEG